MALPSQEKTNAIKALVQNRYMTRLAESIPDAAKQPTMRFYSPSEQPSGSIELYSPTYFMYCGIGIVVSLLRDLFSHTLSLPRRYSQLRNHSHCCDTSGSGEMQYPSQSQRISRHHCGRDPFFSLSIYTERKFNRIESNPFSSSLGLQVTLQWCCCQIWLWKWNDSSGEGMGTNTLGLFPTGALQVRLL